MVGYIDVMEYWLTERLQGGGYDEKQSDKEYERRRIGWRKKMMTDLHWNG